jgi:hypothetical protein
VVLDVFEAKYKCAQVIKRHTCDERAIERVEEVDKCETKVFR